MRKTLSIENGTIQISKSLKYGLSQVEFANIT